MKIPGPPNGVLRVVPANVAVFHATRWIGDYPDPDIQWMAEQFGWTIRGVFQKTVRGQKRDALLITGRNRSGYTVLAGDWVIALGTNGSIRVVSDRQYRQDYREASE